MDQQTHSANAHKFRSLHVAGQPFIMPNAWSAGSAAILAEAGFDVLATTSAGIAYDNAVADYASALPFAEALRQTTAMVNATGLPISMDAENGYADTLAGLQNNYQKIAASGAVGASIEDYTGDPRAPLYALDEAVARVGAARQGVAELAYPFTLTARAECYLVDHPNAFAESVARVNAYHEAGADCLFVPGIKDISTIAELVRETQAPISVVMGLSGTPIALQALADVGVARVSIGGSLARAVLGFVRQAANEMLSKGTFEFAQAQIADAQLCQLFSKNDEP